MSFETRSRFISVAAHVIPVGELYPALAIGAVLGVIGFWRGWSEGGKAEKRRYFLHEDLEWADTVFSAAFMASLLMMFVLQAFKIPSASMEKTLLIGDHLFVNKFLYGMRVPMTGRRILPIRQPRRGDVVVFQFPVDDPTELHCGSVQYGKDFIKRLIGEPGDTIEVRAGRVILNGQLLAEEPYAIHDEPYREPESPHAKEMSPERYQQVWQEHHLDAELQNNQRDFFGPVKVPPHSYFMMGDNRDHSCDSRYWGPVEERYIKGNAWFLYWPPSRMGAVR
ncbi:MAG: signal peptidase I [Elusimicrobia bacterium]|nr:signal peptidase I [Elusimicrobiota bacterium]MDE2510655.1 signal peptidase I [Elusimicrobiota bacterium]